MQLKTGQPLRPHWQKKNNILRKKTLGFRVRSHNWSRSCPEKTRDLMVNYVSKQFSCFFSCTSFFRDEMRSVNASLAICFSAYTRRLFLLVRNYNFSVSLVRHRDTFLFFCHIPDQEPYINKFIIILIESWKSRKVHVNIGSVISKRVLGEADGVLGYT